MIIKKCKKCEQTKFISEFDIIKDKKKPLAIYYASYCKICKSQIAKEHRKNNIDQWRKNQRKWYAKHKKKDKIILTDEEKLLKKREQSRKYAKKQRQIVYNYTNKMFNSLGAGVYLIINLITNKYYIGSSSQIYRRKVTHFSILKSAISPSCLDLQNDMNLYGRDNFTFEVLENIDINNLSKPEISKTLKRSEQHYIELYSFNFKMYNKNKACKLVD